jgi:hypothetical protein
LLVTPVRKRCPSWIAYRPGPSQSGPANSNSSGVAIQRMTFTINEQKRASTLLIRCFARGRSVGDVWVVCVAQAKWLTKPNAGSYVRRSAMMYCPPSRGSATLPAAPCFPRFLGKHARLGMPRAAPSARLLPAAPCHSRLPGNFWPPPAIPSPERVAAPSFLRFPIPGENTRLRLFPWLLPPTAAALAVAANCCRSFCAEICDIGDRRRWSKFSGIHFKKKRNCFARALASQPLPPLRQPLV